MSQLLRLLALLALAAAAAASSAAERIHLVVLHTNDIHGQVLPRPATWIRDVSPTPQTGGLERLGARIAALRSELEGQGSAVVVVDGGDWFQGTPEGGLDDGRAFLEALALVGHDALCVGNHEFDHGVATFRRLMEDLPLPAVLANATAGGESLPGCPPYRIVERGGLRIALVGLLSTSTPRMTPPDVRAELTFEYPARTLERLREELEGEVDWILPLTHIGVDKDRSLARDLPWLDVIVGGHSHTFLSSGTRQGGTLIVQAASKASCVGRVDVWFDAETLEVVESRATTVDLFVDSTPEAPADLKAACAGLVERAGAVMDEVVGELETPLSRSRDRFESSPCGNLVTDVMREAAGADVAFQNKGGLRANIDAGPVTRRELFDLLPFGNTLVSVELTGAELGALLGRSVAGMGGSGLEVSGVEVIVKGGQHPELAELRIGGELVDPERRYRVATSSFLAEGGDAYIEFVRAERKTNHPGMLREHVERWLAGKGSVTPPRANRFKVR